MSEGRRPELSRPSRRDSPNAPAPQRPIVAAPVAASDTVGWRWKCLVVIFLVAAVLVPYVQVLGFDFVDSDDALILRKTPKSTRASRQIWPDLL